MTPPPAPWIASVKTGLEESNLIPLWGSPPPFPWEHFSNVLKEEWGLSNLIIRQERTQFKEALTEGLGQNPVILPLSASPLDGTLFFAMPLGDAQHLTKLLLTKSNKGSSFSDPRFIEGFYNFLALEALAVLNATSPFEDVSVHRAEKTPLPEGGALCIDIALQIPGAALFARVICPPPFHRSFKEHFARKSIDITSDELKRSIEVDLILELGRTTLSLAEWESVMEGDFVALDRCAYDVLEQKGALDIVLGKTPLYQARLKGGKLKILDFALYTEGEGMDEPQDESEKFPEEEEFPPLDEEPSFEEEPIEESKHLWAEVGAAPAPEALLKAMDVPITLKVEAGHLRMPLCKLLELQVGNTLELKTRPEEGVIVTLNGKKVAHAELIQLGEALGIRIVKLGK